MNKLRIRLLLLTLLGTITPCWAQAPQRFTVTVLPTHVKVRSPLPGDGQLEGLFLTGLSDQGLISGYASDLELDYDYRVCWRFSRDQGLQVIDPAYKGPRKRVVDRDGTRVFDSACLAAWDGWILGAHRSATRYFTYSDTAGLSFLEQGEASILQNVRESFSAVSGPVPFEFRGGLKDGSFVGSLWHKDELGNVTFLPYGYFPRDQGWFDASDFDPRFKPPAGETLLVVPMRIRMNRDILVGLGLEGGGQERYVRHRDGSVVSFNIPDTITTVSCEPSNHEELCGVYSFESPANNPNQHFGSWWYSPERGLVKDELNPDDVFLLQMTDDGLAIGTRRWREIVSYSPTLDPEPTVLVSRRELRKLFPAGAKELQIVDWLTNRHGDLLGVATASLADVTFERYFLFIRGAGLFDFLTLLENAEWTPKDKAHVLKRSIELLDLSFWRFNNRAEMACPVRIDGRIAYLYISP